MNHRRSVIIAAVAALIASAIGVWLLAFHDDGKVQPPSPQTVHDTTLKPGEVAVIGQQPVRASDIDVELRQEAALAVCAKGKTCKVPTNKAARDLAYQATIMESWILQEAARRGIKLDKGEYQKRLEAAGYTDKTAPKAVREQIAISTLNGQVMGNDKPAPTPTAAQLRKAYESDPNLTPPRTRSLNVIHSATRERAQKAAAALRAGQPFDEVFAKFNDDLGLQARRGRIEDITQQLLPGAIARGVFLADTGVWTGPVQGDGFWLFKITDAKNPKPVPFEKAREQLIKQVQSAAYNEQQIEKRVELIRFWRPRTKCAADHLTDLCYNGPENSLLAAHDRLLTKNKDLGPDRACARDPKSCLREDPQLPTKQQLETVRRSIRQATEVIEQDERS